MGFVTGAENFDVVSLGDVVTDEFIRLPEGAVRVRVDEQGRWLEIPLGAKVDVGDDATPSAGGAPRTPPWRCHASAFEWDWRAISPTTKRVSIFWRGCMGRESELTS